MRPKLIALIAVSTVALVGCASGEAVSKTSVEPSNTVTIAPEPSPSQDATASKDAFLAQLEVIKEKESQLEGKLKKKASDEYMLERGDKYCELLEDNDLVEPIYSNGKDATDLQIEGMILQSARINLCPTSQDEVSSDLP